METVSYTKKDINEIVAVLKTGGLVAIPTDTVYGLAIASGDGTVYEHLKQVKGRPDSKPFPLMVSSIDQIESLVEMDDVTRYLVNKWMPGPVTFIFKKKQAVFPFLSSQATLGIRMADDPWVKSLIETLGSPIWLPSANKSGQPTGTSSSMVLDQLGGEIEGVVLGEITGGVSSSVFDITQLPEVVMLRAGPIPLANIINSLKDL